LQAELRTKRTGGIILFPRLDKMKKKLIRIGLIILLLFLALFALLHTPLVENQVRRYAIGLLEKKLGLTVEIQSLRYNLVALSFTLRGVTIRAKDEKNLPPFFQAGVIQARVPLSLLTRRNPEIKELSASGLRFIIYKGRDNTSNIPALGSGAESPDGNRSSAPFPGFFFGKMTLSGVSVLYQDTGRGLSIESPSIDILLEKQSRSSHLFLIKSRREGNLIYHDHRASFQSLSARGSLAGNSLGIQDFRFELEQNQIALSGEIRDLRSADLNLRADAEVDLKNLRTFLPAQIRLSGRVLVLSEFEGSIHSLEAKMNLQGRDIILGKSERGSFEAQMDWKEGLLSIPSLRFDLAGGNVSGRAALHPLDWKEGNRARLEWHDLGSSDLVSFFGGTPSFESRSSGQAELTWKETKWTEIFGSADLTFQIPEFPNRKVPFVSVLSGSVHADKKPGQVSIIARQLHTENADLSGEVYIRGESLSGKYHIEAPDLGSIGSMYFPASIKDRLSNLGGNLSVSGRIDGTTDAPEVTSAWEGKGVSLWGMSEMTLTAEASWKNHDVRIQSFRLATESTSFDFSGIYLLGTKRGSASIDFTATGLPLEDVSPYLGGSSELAGIFELEGKITEISPLLRIEGSGKWNGLRYPGWKLNEGSMEYAVTGEKLDYNISVRSPSLSARGTCMLIPPYHFEAAAEMEGSSLTEIQPVFTSLPLRDASGKLTLRLDIKGDAESYREMEISGSAQMDASVLSLNEPPLDFKDMKLDLLLEGRVMEIKPSSFRLKEAPMEVKGRVPLSFLFESSPPDMKSPRVPARIALKFKKLDPVTLASISQKDLSSLLSGIISGSAELSFSALELASLNADLDIEALDLKLGGIPFELEKSDTIRLQSGKLLLGSLALASGRNSIQISGKVDLMKKQFESFSFYGSTDLEIFQSFYDRASYSGKSQYRIELNGPFANPSVAGLIELQNVEAEISDPDLYLNGLSGEIRLSGNTITVSGLKGSLNGGKITVGGTVSHQSFILEKADLNLSFEEIGLDYPADLHSLLDGRLTFLSDGVKHVLGGDVNLLYAEYSEPFNVESQLFRFLSGKGGGPIIIERNEFLNNLDFNIRIDTSNPAKIDNNLADASARANLKLTGSTYDPGLSGRVEFIEGGEVFLAKNTYQIEQASVDFINPSRIVPDINLRAQTRVSGYLIQLQVSGTFDNLSANLVSDPPLSQSDIVSLLLTGQRLEYVSSSLLNMVGSQALNYLEGAVLGQVERIAEQTFGLESISIDTSLIAPQENPQARITIGQHITPRLEVIFSQGLRETDERTVILNYNPLQNLNLRGIKQDNDTYQFGAMHELLFGLKKTEKMGPVYDIERKGPVIAKVEFLGETGLPPEMIARKLKLKAGKRFNFFVLQKDMERITRLYRKQDYLEFELAYRKRESEGKVILTYQISSGPRITMSVSGVKLSRKTLKEAERLWMEGSFFKKRAADVESLIRRKFFKKGYYRMKVEVGEESDSSAANTVRIQISPGVRYRRIDFSFQGRSGLSKKTLISLLKERDSVLALFSYPPDLMDEMKALYRQNGYLEAEVKNPRIDFQVADRTVNVSFSIQEGPRFLVGRIEFRGRASVDRKSLLKAAGMTEGEPFIPDAWYKARSNLESFYSKLGYVNARIQSRIEMDPEAGSAALIFDIEENEKAVIQNISIFNNQITRNDVIEREFTFKTGQPVDFLKFAEAQKKLYSLAIFNSVSIDTHPVDNEEGQEKNSSNQRPYQVEVLVEEMEPYYLRYGGQYDTDTGIGGVAELVRRNFLGRAIDLGGSIQANLREQDARIYLRSPYFLGKRMDTSLFVYANSNKEPDFTTGRVGTTLQQQLTIKKEFVISYYYTFENLRNLAGETPLPEERYNIGRVSFSLSRDRRKNIFNSLQGSFLSLIGEYAEKFLGSDVRYLRFFGQYYTYLPLGRFLTYASAVRIGLGHGLGQELVPSERFFAGGSSSIRGFGYHEVGPKNPATGNPTGGNAVFILNQELRFPIYKILSGVVFVDAGKVYANISDFDPLDIRKTAGWGLRLDLGIVMGRLDWGFKLDRRSGESLSHIYFSLGQAF
jgi:outer membrane protein assembly complex protein YaeT